MWERDRFVNGIISIRHCLFVGLCLCPLASLPTKLVYILVFPPADHFKVTGEHLRQFPPSARILVAAKLKPTRFFKTVAIVGQVTPSVLSGTTSQYCRRSVPLISEPATCRQTILYAFKRFVSAIVLAPV